MRNLLKNILLASVVAVMGASCAKEEPIVEVRESIPVEIGFGFERMLPVEVDTKSIINVAGFESKFTSITYGAYSGGKLFASAYYSDAGGGLNTANTTLTLEKGFTFTVYAFVNMGDLRSSLPQAESGISNVGYTLSAYTGSSVDAVAARGIPMAGSLTFKPSENVENRTIPLKRLLAKVTAILSCNWDGARISSAKVYQMNAKLTPFGTSMAASSSDLLTFQEVETGNNTGNLTATFYVPENMQGEYGIVSSEDKTAENALIASRAGRLTYLETVVTSTGKYEGTVKYRSYLGGNATGNFNVEGNKHYTWTINYRSATVDDYQDDWKHDYDGDPSNTMKVREYGISLSPTPNTIVGLGNTFTYTTTFTTHQLKPENNYSYSTLSNGSCSWESSNPGVVTVSNGVVTSVSAGTANITARYTAPGYDNTQVSAVGQVTVQNVVTHYLAITGDASASVGGSISLKAWYHTVTNDVDDGGVDVTSSATWTRQSGSDKISVSSAGVVTATSPGGTAVIRASYAGQTADKEVAFNPVMGYRLAITASPGASVNEGAEISLSAKFYTTTDGVEDSGVDVTTSTTWSKVSGGASISVSSAGKVNSASAATGTIRGTYTYGGTNYWDAVDVTFLHVPVINHTLVVSGNSSANVGQNIGLTATYKTFTDGVETYSQNVTSSATWSRRSGSGNISVSSSGVVSATNPSHTQSAFSAVIGCEYSGESSDGFTVTFNPVVSHYLTVSASPTSTTVGNTIQMSAVYHTNVDGYHSQENVSASNVTWQRLNSGSNYSRISVNGSGVVSCSSTGDGSGASSTVQGTYLGQSGTAGVSFSDVVTHTLTVTSNNGYSAAHSGTIQLVATYRTYVNSSLTNTQNVSSSATWNKSSNSVNITPGSTYAGVTAVGTQSAAADIYATYSGTTSSAVHVDFADDIVEELIVTPNVSSQKWGSTISMSARLKTTVNGGTPTYQNLSAWGMIWSTSNTGASGNYTSISVSSDGIVSYNPGTAVGGATRRIVGQYTGSTGVVSGYADVTFTDLYELVISPTSSTGNAIGSNVVLTLKYMCNNIEHAISSGVTWTSSNSNIAVSSSGNGTCTVTTVSENVGGSATITATFVSPPAGATFSPNYKEVSISFQNSVIDDGWDNEGELDL